MNLLKPLTERKETSHAYFNTRSKERQVTVKCAFKNGKYLYQWTAIDKCTRVRFVYAFEEHTPENTGKFLKMFVKVFSFNSTIQLLKEKLTTKKILSQCKLLRFTYASS